MPYTLSHPAAILPIWHLSRKRLRLAALVIGAATPDFFYLLTGLSLGRFSHTMTGMVVLCLPLGWLALMLFDRWGRSGVEAILPKSWRLPPSPKPLRPFVRTSVAILLGAFSHILWDSFTHRSGWAVQALPALSLSVVLEPFPAVPLYRVLQHVSTVVGLAVLAWPCWCWMRRQAPVAAGWLIKRALLCGCFLGAIGVFNGLRFLHRGVGQFIVGGGVGVAVALLLGCLLLGYFKQMAPARVEQ